jgi:hypothetical protein
LVIDKIHDLSVVYLFLAVFCFMLKPNNLPKKCVLIRYLMKSKRKDDL